MDPETPWEPDEPAHLFAYGTLKPRSGDEAASAGWTVDALRGRLYDLGPYPALVDLDDPSAPWIEGFVRPVGRSELIEVLDVYEGIDEGPFARRAATSRAGRRVWVYVHSRALPASARGPVLVWNPPDPEFRPDLGRRYSSGEP